MCNNIIIYHQLSQAEQARASVVQYSLSGHLHFKCTLGFTEKLFTLASVWKVAGIRQNVGQDYLELKVVNNSNPTIAKLTRKVES